MSDFYSTWLNRTKKMSISPKKFRVTFLTKTILFISIASSSLALIFSLFLSISYNLTNKASLLDKLPNFLHFFRENILFYLEKGGTTYFIIYGFVCVLIISGCVIMLRGKRIGFSYFLYGQILSTILPLLFFNKRGIGLGDIMLSLLFIFFYFIQINIHTIKQMNSSQENESIGDPEEIEDLIDLENWNEDIKNYILVLIF